MGRGRGGDRGREKKDVKGEEGEMESEGLGFFFLARKNSDPISQFSFESVYDHDGDFENLKIGGGLTFSFSFLFYQSAEESKSQERAAGEKKD